MSTTSGGAVPSDVTDDEWAFVAPCQPGDVLSWVAVFQQAQRSMRGYCAARWRVTTGPATIDTRRPAAASSTRRSTCRVELAGAAGAPANEWARSPTRSRTPLATPWTWPGATTGTRGPIPPRRWTGLASNWWSGGQGRGTASCCCPGLGWGSAPSRGRPAPAGWSRMTRVCPGPSPACTSHAS